jgi:hypothetical protein
MRSVRPVKPAGILAAVLVFTSIMTCRLGANEPYGHYWVSHDPSIGYAVPIQHVYQFPAAFVDQPTAPRGYAVPIQRVYQFQAPFSYRPGFEVPFGGVVYSAYDQYAGPSFIPR